MNFKSILAYLLFCALLALLTSCSDEADEENLVDLFTTASQDVIAINFPTSTETVYSTNSEFTFTLEGLKPNGVDTVTINNRIEWSLSDNAMSTIDQQGRFTAASTPESITLTARLGALSTSLDIRISAAKFDQVIQLNTDTVSINMCQSVIITPVGRYIDEFGAEEIRPVDSTVIDNIEWIILNAEDSSPSQRAYIQTLNNTTSIHSLESGNIIVQARATSIHSGNLVTSADLNQTIGNELNSIKLCLASSNDLDGCSLGNPSVETDSSVSLVAVGNYPSSNSTTISRNITRNTKWGRSNNNISTVFSSDLQQYTVTGEVDENTNTTISFACGVIQQSLAGIDITQGVNLPNDIICSTTESCVFASDSIDIDELSVTSLEVTANDIDLSSNQSITLNQRPDEITLVVTALFSNSTEAVITTDNTLAYRIIPIDGQVDVIEEKSGSDGVFTVLAAGTARIQLDYRNETFFVVIQMP